MNRSIAVSVFFICAICTSTVASYQCNNNNSTNESSSSFPNKIFQKNVKIDRKEDPDQRTQLRIRLWPTKDYLENTCKVILSSEGNNCFIHSEQIFNLKESVTIPSLKKSDEYLKPGCNYSLVFIVENFCVQTYYQIPEKRPCEHFPLEDTFDTFPNKILDDVSIYAYRKNAIRLNISFSVKPEYINSSGSIVISSKVPRCNHREEFLFSLAETSLVIPRAEFPHSFIDVGCDYMIDFELNDGYCVTTNYKVPDLCIGNKPNAEITDVVKEENGRYKIRWNYKTNERNKTYPIINIGYRLEDVPYSVFNNHMIIGNNFSSNYTYLNFSGLKKSGMYRLVATFINEKECSNVSSFDFEVKGEPGMLIVIIASSILLFTIVPTICICIPCLRSRIVHFSKHLFGKQKQVPLPRSDDDKNIMRRRIEYNTLYVPLELQNCDKFEFSLKFQKLEFETNSEPKPGNFGQVYRARAYGLNTVKGFTTVAVKMVKDNASEDEIQALKEEISTLRKIASHGNHENVVKMLACCSIKKPYMILLEFVACGDLKSYLKDLRNEWLLRKRNGHFIFPGDATSNGSYISPNTRTISETSSSLPSPTETESTVLFDDTDDSPLPPTTPSKITPALSNDELQNFAIQIARGMAFLESISLVHRDLAARNVLINENRILKISDFGMSRIGDYVHRNDGPQPLRWMAPESIEKFTCTSKSDVWSFGVVLWEIGTLGAFPYDSISNDCILEYLLYSLKREIRLMRPEICTDELYSLMLKCWSLKPEERPSFQQIVDHLNGKNKKIYLDFRKLSPAYVFPPTKES